MSERNPGSSSVPSKMEVTPSWILILCGLLLLVVGTSGVYHHHLHADPALAIPFCQERTPGQCCPGRNDDCIMLILDTVCYCDQFCNRLVMRSSGSCVYLPLSSSTARQCDSNGHNRLSLRILSDHLF